MNVAVVVGVLVFVKFAFVASVLKLVVGVDDIVLLDVVYAVGLVVVVKL